MTIGGYTANSDAEAQYLAVVGLRLGSCSCCKGSGRCVELVTIGGTIAGDREFGRGPANHVDLARVSASSSLVDCSGRAQSLQASGRDPCVRRYRHMGTRLSWFS
jgi:hypothetical protein